MLAVNNDCKWLQTSDAAQTLQTEIREGSHAFSISEEQKLSLTLAKATLYAAGEQWVTKDTTPDPTDITVEHRSGVPAVTLSLTQKISTVSKMCIVQVRF